MDKTISRIAECGSGVTYHSLPATVIHECKRHILDTLGCAYAAYDAEPALMSRRLALLAQASTGARVLGTAHRSTPELAAFANGVMIRYLDGNDAFPGGGGGHPSDTLGALLAATDMTRASGKDLIAATVATYEIYHRLFESSRIQDKGWDHVFYTAVASTVGVCRLLGLSPEKTRNAIALSITPNLALEVTRRGDLSMWKGCAGANAARNGVFAACLAAEGMTGPAMAVEGKRGLWEVVGKFEFDPVVHASDGFRILSANLKLFLAEYHAQAPITVALALHGQVPLEDIERITIYTYQFASIRNKGDVGLSQTLTRETADHSISYMVAAALIDGSFSDAIFSDDRLKDGNIHWLMKTIEVVEDMDYTRAYPELNPCRIEILCKDGQRKSAAVDYPLGHVKNPMSDHEVEEKYRSLSARALPPEQIASLSAHVWRLEHLADASVLLDTTPG